MRDYISYKAAIDGIVEDLVELSKQPLEITGAEVRIRADRLNSRLEALDPEVNNTIRSLDADTSKREFYLNGLPVIMDKEELSRNVERLKETLHQMEGAMKELEEEKEPVFDYPICCKSKIDDMILLFIGIEEGTVLKGDGKFSKIGQHSKDWVPHTDNIWEEIPYDKERGFYHKQPVYCWDSDDTHTATIRFYDAINKGNFTWSGKNISERYDCYSSEMPEHMKEFKEIK